jgi:NAD(P)-dependent dehydrogenase (short-subunit alcohol dehydrogenase family)
MQVLLITGANGGIGTEICKLFKQKKWYIIATDIQPKSNHSYHDQYISADLCISKSIQNILSKINDLSCPVNCLINCAAYQCCKPIWEYTELEWDNTYNCNVKSIFLIIKYGFSIFKKYNTNIINIASVHASLTSKNIASYASSKAAIVGLTRNMAIDLSKYKIRVNSISPGAVNTSMLTNHLTQESLDYLTNKHLLKTIGTPTQIAETCLFINNNTFINGSNLIIDGGITCQLCSE